MTTFLDYTVELLIDPDDPQIDFEDRVRVGFTYVGATSLVFLATGHRSGTTYDPGVHTLISTHAMECAARYPVHLHIDDREQILYARTMLNDWFSGPGSREDMPEEVRNEIRLHLDELGHYLAGGVWEIEIQRFAAPNLRVGNYPTPNAATAAINSGQVWDRAGVDPTDDEQEIERVFVATVPIGVDTATR